MDKVMIDFKENVDSWIKKINRDISKIKELPDIMEENIDNVQHNYELVNQLRQEFDDIKKEVKLLRIIQLMVLKKYNEKNT